MIGSNRKFFSKEKQLLISFDESTQKENYQLKEVSWNEEKTLGYLFQQFLSDNNIEINDNYLLYLKREDIIIKKLSKEKPLYELDLKKNDEIMVSFKSYNALPLREKSKKSSNNLNTNQDNNNFFNNENEKKYLETNKSLVSSKKERDKTKKRNILFLFIAIILFLLFLITIIFLIKRLKNNKHKKYIKEKLIANKKYPINLLLRYNISKIYNIELESEEKVFQTVSQEMDFIFIVRKNKKEINEKDLIEKEKFEGYIALLNAKIINETDEQISVYDRKLNYILDGQILDRNKQKELY